MPVSGSFTSLLRLRRLNKDLSQRLLTQWVSVSIGLGTLFGGTSASFADIISDNSTGSIVEFGDCLGFACIIRGGETQGDNLFHSFSEFVIPPGGNAILSTPGVLTTSNVNRIFIRVVGSSTEVDGSFTVDNFFFLNSPDIIFLSPQGIRIGQDAQLDYSGSLLFSTAERLDFGGGAIFDATTSDPLLTLADFGNLPTSLQLGANPGAINFGNSSSTIRESLSIPKTHQHQFAVISDQISFDNIEISTPGALTILSVDENQVIGLTPQTPSGIVFNYPTSIDASDVALNNSGLSISSLSSSNNAEIIEIIGDNLRLTQNSDIRAETDLQGGNIRFDLTGLLELETDSQIFTKANGASAVAGEISIDSNQIRLIQDSRINSSSTTTGGDINLTVSGLLELNSLSTITTQATAATASAGNIVISAGSLSLFEQNEIATSSNSTAGDINLTIAGDVLIGELSHISTSPSATATSGSNITLDASGQVQLLNQGIISTQPNADSASFGLIELSSASLDLINQSEISTTAGEISIDSGQIQLAQSSQIKSSTDTSGGNITLNSSGQVELNSLSTITTQATTSTASAGNIALSAGSLSLLAQNEIVTNSNSGDGEINLAIAGDVLIENSSHISTFASEPTTNGSNITLNASGLVELNSQGKITTQATTATAHAGNIDLSAANLSLLELNEISTQTNSGGGDIILTVAGDVQVNGSSLVATTAENNAAIAGNITLASDALTVDSGGRIISGFNGFTSGSLDIDVDEVNLSGDGEIATVAHDPSAPGSGASAGNIAIDGTNVSIQSGGKIYTLTEDMGGNLTFVLTGDLSISNSGSQVAVRAAGSGNAGDLTLTARNLSLSDQSQILSETGQSAGALSVNLGGDLTLNTGGSINSVATEGSGGSAGNINIVGGRNFTTDGANSNGTSSEIASRAEAGGGDISLDFSSGDVTLREGAQIKTSITLNGNIIQGDAGNLNLQAQDLLLSENSSVLTETAGGKGNIGLDLSGRLSVVDGSSVASQVSSTSAAIITGAAGTITIDANSLFFSQGNLRSETGQPGGDIHVTATNAIEFVQSQVRLSSSSGEGHTGNLSLTSQASAPNTGIRFVESEVSNEATNMGGDVTFTTPGEVELQDGNFISIDSSGRDGNFRISASAFRSNAIGADNDVLLNQGSVSKLLLPADVTGFDVSANQVVRNNGNSELLPNLFPPPVALPVTPPSVGVTPPSPPELKEPQTPLPPVISPLNNHPIVEPLDTLTSSPTPPETNGNTPPPSSEFRYLPSQTENFLTLEALLAFYGDSQSSSGDFRPISCLASGPSFFQMSGRGGIGDSPSSLHGSSSLADLGQVDGDAISERSTHFSQSIVQSAVTRPQWHEAQAWQQSPNGDIELIAQSDLMRVQPQAQGCEFLHGLIAMGR